MPILRVLNPSELDEIEKERLRASAPIQPEKVSLAPEPEQKLVSYVMDKFTYFSRERESQGIDQALIDALRKYKGEYAPQKLQEIRKMGGSEVYCRVVSSKCRAATSLLRDIYLTAERPWKVSPTPVSDLPDDDAMLLAQRAQQEVLALAQSGVPVTSDLVKQRFDELKRAALKEHSTLAEREAAKQSERLEDILVEGRFYEALAEFLIDLPVFPYAVLKGPYVEYKFVMRWEDGVPTRRMEPKLMWKRVSPFDLYFSPYETRPEYREYIERITVTRSDLNQWRASGGGFNKSAIEDILDRLDSGLLNNWLSLTNSSEREALEARESRATAKGVVDMLEFHGFISGKLLKEYGVSDKLQDKIDPLAEYSCRVWVLDDRVVHIVINPHTSQRPIYRVTSYDKIPGSSVGHGLPQILSDYESVMNACLRSLVNNMAIASGPQVEVNMDRLADTDDASNLYPWKRWFVHSDLTGSNQPAVRFFSPQSNVQELLYVYSQMLQYSDDASGIPRYMSGASAGGAGRTASGLNMLMQNASKVIQTVASYIDEDVIAPTLRDLHELLMLTDPEGYSGDINISVTGVTKALQRETERMRQLEFLQLTANPIDMQIVGPGVRAEILKEVASNLGLNRVRDSMPNADEVESKVQQMQQSQQQGGVSDVQEGSPQAEAAPMQQTVRGPSGSI